jgi:hypothetical protein
MKRLTAQHPALVTWTAMCGIAALALSAVSQVL